VGSGGGDVRVRVLQAGEATHARLLADADALERAAPLPGAPPRAASSKMGAPPGRSGAAPSRTRGAATALGGLEAMEEDAFASDAVLLSFHEAGIAWRAAWGGAALLAAEADSPHRGARDGWTAALARAALGAEAAGAESEAAWEDAGWSGSDDDDGDGDGDSTEDEAAEESRGAGGDSETDDGLAAATALSGTALRPGHLALHTRISDAG
jgi:hypothetical protein